MTAETFDAVLAEARELLNVYGELTPVVTTEFLGRLAAAHTAALLKAADVLQAERLEHTSADAATALLRECLPYIEGHAQASHLTDGFKRRPNNAHDDLAARVAGMVGRE